MKQLTCVLVLLLLIGIGTSCDKGPDPNGPIVFEGLTLIDENGLVLGFDSDDWRLDDEWRDDEAALFMENKSTDCNDAAGWDIIGYPNPSDGQFFIQMAKPESVRLAYRLVDEDLNVLISRDSIFNDVIIVNARNFLIQDTVRMYYKLIDGECEYRGHGDLLFQ